MESEKSFAYNSLNNKVLILLIFPKSHIDGVKLILNTLQCHEMLARDKSTCHGALRMGRIHFSGEQRVGHII
jgi:hypothetical protein